MVWSLAPHKIHRIVRCSYGGSIFHFQSAPTGTLSRWQYRDHFVDLLRNRFGVTLPVGGAGLAPRWLRLLFPPAPGTRCGLSLVGHAALFQLPLQPLVLRA